MREKVECHQHRVGFSRVEFGVGKLERNHEVVFIEMVSKSVYKKSFCEFYD